MARRRGYFDFDSLTPALKKALPAVDAAVDLVFDVFARKAETQMRSNAPWTDRTANARNGLFAEHIADHMISHQLVLYHTMPYGLWLEVRWSGRFAIIGPTMFDISGDLATTLAEAVQIALDRLG